MPVKSYSYAPRTSLTSVKKKKEENKKPENQIAIQPSPSAPPLEMMLETPTCSENSPSLNISANEGDNIEDMLLAVRSNFKNALEAAVKAEEINEYDKKNILEVVDAAVKAVNDNPSEPGTWKKPFGKVTNTINRAYKNKAVEKTEGNYCYITEGAMHVVGAAAAAAVGFGVVVGIMALWAVMPPAAAALVALTVCFMPEVLIGGIFALGAGYAVGAVLGRAVAAPMVGTATGSTKVSNHFNQHVQKVERPCQGENKPASINNMYGAFSRQIANARNAAETARNMILSEPAAAAGPVETTGLVSA
ncbi:MAG: hypothetical protein K0R12_539 [Gammaproteobacteria bacterium]|jgi:hypothetical protein|nr:hypothetical protein [Gammaproteobacteria bacterium]